MASPHYESLYRRKWTCAHLIEDCRALLNDPRFAESLLKEETVIGVSHRREKARAYLLGSYMLCEQAVNLYPPLKNGFISWDSILEAIPKAEKILSKTGRLNESDIRYLSSTLGSLYSFASEMT